MHVSLPQTSLPPPISLFSSLPSLPSLPHQVALYCLMLEEKLRCQATPPTPPPAPGGLLFYLQTGHLQGLPLLPHEKRGLLIARNRLARYLGSVATPTLPEMLRDRHTCQYCPLLRQCLLHHKSASHPHTLTSRLLTRTLTPLHSIHPLIPPHLADIPNSHPHTLTAIHLHPPPFISLPPPFVSLPPPIFSLPPPLSPAGQLRMGLRRPVALAHSSTITPTPSHPHTCSSTQSGIDCC